MFGNPSISTTPVDDIYSSQANLGGNSFQNPINPANMNPGWGIDPSLLSPSYSAGYRPQYTGQQGYVPQSNNRGFFSGLANLSPTSKDLPWGNPYLHQRESIEDVSGRPADAAAWGAQRIAAPAAAFAAGRWATSRLGLGWAAGARFGAGLGGGMASGFGFAGASTGGLRATGQAISTAYKANGFMGAASAIRGIGFGGAMNLGARGLMGSAMGAASALAMPLVIGQGLMYGAEKTMFDPYINTRMSAKNLRDNFAGISFSDSTGNAVTGGGLGYGESTRMAQEITHQGISDMTFSTGQYRQGADMLARSGLLDKTNSKGITKAIKESMEQVKLIMNIANMPEIQDAIEQLAKLQQSGASIKGGYSSVASGTMRTLGGLAAAAGTSVNKLMNTVGAQGQYLYQANGMTPYLGQIAAAGAYSAFAAGKRTGLISTEQIARMGGIDGATQSSLTGQINASQTMFNQMALYNSFIGGGKGGSAFGRGEDMLQVTGQFGRTMTQDPLGTYGGLLLHSRQMAGKQMEERGSLAIQDQVMAIARNLPGVIDPKTGTISAERAAPILMQMGFDRDSIQAYYSQLSAETDPESLAQRRKGLFTNYKEQSAQFISQNGIYGGPIGGSIYKLNKAGRAITNSISEAFVDPISGATGSFGDTVQKVTDWAWFGSTNNRGVDNLNQYIGTKSPAAKAPPTGLEVFENPYNYARGDDYKFPGADLVNNSNIAKNLSELANRGDSKAIAYFQEKDTKKRSAILREMIKGESFGKAITRSFSEGDTSKAAERLTNLDYFLDTSRKIKVPTKEDPGAGPSGWVSKNGAITAVYKEPKIPESEFTKDLKYATGSENGLETDRLKTLDLAGKIINDMQIGKLNVTDSEETINKNESVAAFIKATNSKGGVKALGEADAMYKRGASKGLTALAEEVAGRKDTWNDAANKTKYDEAIKNGDKVGADRIKVLDSANKIGGKMGQLQNATDLTTKEVYDYEQIQKEYSRADNKLLDLAKNNQIDLTTYKTAQAAVDMSRAVDKFSKAVDKFDKQDSSTPEKGSSSWYGWQNLPERFGWSNQRSPEGSAGNKK